MCIILVFCVCVYIAQIYSVYSVYIVCKQEYVYLLLYGVIFYNFQIIFRFLSKGCSVIVGQ